jgi:hypothetical protein
MLTFIRTLVRVTSPKSSEAKPATLRALSVQETEAVSGGFNPQPDPPGRNFGLVVGTLAFGAGGGAGRS